MRPGRSLRRRCGRRDAGNCQGVSAAAEDAGGEDAGAEAAAAFEGGFCAGVEGLVHPVAGTAFADAAEADALEVEFLTDEGVEVDAADDDIAAEDGGWGVRDVEGGAEILVDLVGEEGDLAFVVFLPAEEAIAFDAFAGDERGFVEFDDGGLAGWLAVVTEVIVFGADVEVLHCHGG